MLTVKGPHQCIFCSDNMLSIDNISNQTFSPNWPGKFPNIYTSSSQLWLQSSVFALIQIFGLAGNLLVVTSVLKERRLRTNYYLTVLNLSFCDIGLLACSIIEWQIFPWMWHNGHVLKNFGLICKLWLTGLAWFYTNGVYFMVFIGYLRYRSVVKPFKERLSRKRVLLTIVLMYLISVLFFTPKFISLDEEHYRCFDNYSGIVLYDLYSHCQPAFLFLFPMLILCFLYAKLCFSLHKHSKNIQSCDMTHNRPDLTKSRLAFALQRRNTKAIFTGIIIVAIFCISNVPVQIQTQLTFVEGNYNIELGFWTFALFYTSSACLNPYVYALLDDAIFACFKKRLKIICCRNAGI